MIPLVALLTDFGAGSVYVGQLHAVLARLAPEARVLDLVHDVPPGDVEAGAYLLRQSVPHLPEACVVLAVVDPGVGTARAILAGRAEGRSFVGPDNGLLAPVLGGGDARRLENPALLPAHVSATFHGRDLMAPLAARLACGLPRADGGWAVGPIPLAGGPRLANGVVVGRVLVVDRFGNLVTNVPATLLARLEVPAREVRVRAGSAFVEGIVSTYADVPSGRALAYVGSGGHLEVGVHGGRAADLLRLAPGAEVRVERSRP